MITAIVLAAGKSSRMEGKNKMFLPFRATTVISTVIAELIMSKVDEIVVVTDSEEHFNELAIISTVKACVNNDRDNGLTSSIQVGVDFASKNSDYLICLGDMPLVTSKEYNLLINSLMKSNEQQIVQPIYKGQPGNPVLFSNHFRTEILNLADSNGCKPIVKQNRSYLTQVDMPTDSIHQDIDTEEDYNNLLNRIS